MFMFMLEIKKKKNWIRLPKRDLMVNATWNIINMKYIGKMCKYYVFISLLYR